MADMISFISAMPVLSSKPRNSNISISLLLPFFFIKFPNTCLLVGCCNDETTHKCKGKTVTTEKERNESLRHCRWIDEVITDAPWVMTREFLDKHHIDYVAHDSLPYVDASGAGKDVYEFETKRTDGISTSDIIMRIVKDYNQYVMRDLDRGYTRKELGVSYVKIQSVAKTSGMHHEELVEKLAAGFFEMFEERCHKMGTAIRERIQEQLRVQQLRGLMYHDNDDDDNEMYDGS